MQKRVITVLMVLAGASLGISSLPLGWEMIGQQQNAWLNNNVTNSLIGALIFYLFSLLVTNMISTGIQKIEKWLSGFSLTYLLFGVIGTILGLI
ncbi:MAG: PIN domain nuclease, partial [Tetragenococcus koreensis]|nr:PIN domain nuclease [Tetragenococcus koreensis]